MNANSAGTMAEQNLARKLIPADFAKKAIIARQNPLYD